MTTTSILFPLFMILSVIRMALTPLFVNLEYRLPGFPVDHYGFSTADRLYWSQYSINYLLGKVSHSDFSLQTLPDGTSLFNARELSHMLDVRNLTTLTISIWTGLLVFFTVAFLLCWSKNWLDDLLRALKNGGLVTILIIVVILLSVWLNFDALFTKFHEIFFEGDSWLFYPSDNLIRLFPLRLWRDLFIFIGSNTLIGCLIPVLLWNRIRNLSNQKAQN